MMEHTLAHNQRDVQRTYQKTDWSAAIWAGLIAGVVFMVMEMLLVMFFQGASPWGPPRMIAAMALGQDVLPPPADFDAKIMMTAMMIHFPLSIAIGLFIGWVVHRMTLIRALIAGGAISIAIYIINFYLFAPMMFPWFTQAQNWISALSHMVFGLAIGGAYVALRKPSPETQ